MIGMGLEHLRDLFVGGSAVGLSDGELLARYADSRDGPAFAALVARHGPMVAATCRAVLRDHHDVEDAFQATFLVLARKAHLIRAGDALGGWLHRVAYRAAVQRNAEVKRRRRHESEVSATERPDSPRPGLDFDVRSILHDEIDRLPEAQRLPVVLCDLEGLTYDQAAARLHWTAPTLYHRLARGRRRLRDRLIRRGVTAGAAGVAIASATAPAAAAVPAAWAQAAVAAATGGPIPATVAALIHSLVWSPLMTSMKITSAAIVGLTALIATAVIVVGVTRHGAPKTPALITSVAENTDQPKPHTRPADPDVPGFNQEPPLHSALRIARLKHAGDWNLAPRAIPNLMEAIRKPPVSSAIALTEKDLFPRDPTLIYYPLLYIHGRGSFSFPREDLEAIRRHLDPGGGTLLADADCGSPAFDAAFRRFVVDLLPQRPLEPIPPDDEIFTDKVGFDLRDCQYTRAAGGVRGFPQLEGVRINGHWGIIYSKFDLGCALDRRRAGEDWTGYTYDSAFKIVGNVLIYLTLP